MDWTGGTRRRFAKTKYNVVFQKQKSYFAKAREGLRDQYRSEKGSTHRNGTERSHSKASNSAPQRRSSQSGGHRHYESRRSHNPGQLYDREASMATRQYGNASKRSHSVISISSDARSGTWSSLSSSLTSQQHSTSRRTASQAARQLSGEDRIMQTNKYRLLARGDWLSLAARKPLRMRFASVSDKDRVGKRRKIDRSARRKQILNPQYPTLRPFERTHHENGMLSPHDNLSQQIEIKIGTDALKSHTQPSRASREPRGSSIGYVSDNLGALSEGPMLLGGEHDTHEMTTLPEAYIDDASVNELGTTSLSRSASDVSDNSSHGTARILDIRIPIDLLQRDFDLNHEFPRLGSQSANGPIVELHQLAQHSQASSTKVLHSADTIEQEAEVLAEDQEVDDDQLWRDALRIHPASPDKWSTKGLRSGWMEDSTTSSSTLLPKIAPPAPAQDVAAPNIARVDTSARPMKDDPTQDRESDILEHAKKADIASVHYGRNRDEIDDNELWKRFMVGSRSSSEGSVEELVGAAEVYEPDFKVMPATSNFSIFSISSLGASNEATLANSVTEVEDELQSVAGDRANGTTPLPVRDVSPSRTNDTIETDSMNGVTLPREHLRKDDRKFSSRVPFDRKMAFKRSTNHEKRKIQNPHRFRMIK